MSKAEKKEEKAVVVARVGAQQPEPVVYVGTTQQSIGLVQHTVFRNGLPSPVQSHIEKCPAIGRLMVPIRQLAEAKKNLHEVGSSEHTLNEQVNKYVRGDQ